MQDRLMAFALILVLGICCIGAYVAISSFNLVSPKGLDLGFMSAVLTPLPFGPGKVVTGTVTVAAGTGIAAIPSTTAPPTAAANSTAPPTITPAGLTVSATLARTATETPFPAVTFVATSSPAAPATNPASQPQPQGGCQGFDYCPQIGAPDAVLAPTGKACPAEYLWGRVLDQNGQGVTNVKVRYSDSAGNSGSAFVKDRAPDLPGAWNVPTSGPSGTWTLQLLTADDRALSPKYTIAAGRPSAAGGLCGTRVDFRRVK